MERTQRLAGIKGSFSPKISVSAVKRLRVIKQVFLPPSVSPAWQAHPSLSCDFAVLGPLKALRQEKFLRNEFLHFCLLLCWVFAAARRLSLVAVSRGYSLLCCAGFSLRWLLLLQSMHSRCFGFSGCGSWALEGQLSGCGTWASLPLWHIGSSQTRD